MTWTQQQYLDAVTAALDSAGSLRFGSVETLVALTVAHRREWREILKAKPAYRMQVVTAATDANGQVALSGLSSGTQDVKKRFFQVLVDRLYTGTQRYTRANPRELAYALGQPTQVNAARLWYRADTYLQFLPVASGLSFAVPVNHFPSALNAVSAANIAIEFPEDYEQLIVYSACALLFAKGDLETKGTADFMALASPLRSDLLSEIAHVVPGEDVIAAGDNPEEWGG